MKITRVEPIVLRDRSDGDHLEDIYSAFLVRVHTDDGLSGLGQGITAPYVARTIVEMPGHSDTPALNEVLVGESPLQIARLWEKMFAASYQYGRDAAALHVISAIDMALWDIAGKATGLSVCELLGGRYADRVEVYASEEMPETPEDVVRVAEQSRLAGIPALKLGWGPLGGDVGRDVELLAAAREVLGSEARLMVDGGMAYTLKSARDFCQRTESLDLFWFEEPFGPEDIRSYRRLSDAVNVRIACGEAHSTLRPFQTLIEEGHVDVLQPDIGRCGGFTVATNIAALARVHNVEVAPHCFSSDVLLAASLHFAASLPGQRFLEYPIGAYTRTRSITKEPLRPIDGWLSLPDGPGLGIELDDDEIERRRAL